MKIDSGEDFLALLNRLLEGLHQAGMTNFGSHLSIVYVASGAQATCSSMPQAASTWRIKLSLERSLTPSSRPTPPLTPPLKGVGNWWWKSGSGDASGC